jgi:hypothetical protein
MYFALQRTMTKPMSNLDKALAEISAIRGQMARASQFRGYGPRTFAATGVLAMLAAQAQSAWLPAPADHFSDWLRLWVLIAALSAALIGFEMVTRSRRLHSDLAPEMIGAAVEQALPAFAAGVLVTPVLIHFAPASVSLLPGLWQIAFSLGVFASCRFLPRPMMLVGVWYMTTGLACLALANSVHAFSPWLMGLPFGIGQLLVAGLLNFSLEARDERV